MQYVRYNPTDSYFKSVVGAVAEGRRFGIRLELAKVVNPSAVFIVLYRDGGGERLRCPMCKEVGEGEYDAYVVGMALNKGLYFYYFEMEGVAYEHFIGIAADKTPCMYYDDVQPWQLSVYKQKYPTVNWLNKGVMYQILTDRFCASGQSVATEDKIMRRWGEQPYLCDSDGVVRNRDFFGGDLRGIISKLDYLSSLGVTTLYLNPVFKAYSNHKYDTEDYELIDPMFGTNQDFADLCKLAQEKGIRVVLDGVFNHVGATSKYFDLLGKCGGAYVNQDSPYRQWFTFYADGSYECWWNFRSLPRIDAGNKHAQNYFCGNNGIVRKWLNQGASGWRLDVVDEIADCMLDKIVSAAKQQNPQAAIIGEVWEDASNKMAYGVRRHYLDGSQLDSVMNYPLMKGIIRLVSKGQSDLLGQTVFDLLNNYPVYVRNNLMNVLGTHDTARLITSLVGESADGVSKDVLSKRKLTDEQYRQGLNSARIAAVLQYTFFGFPCVFYGDETAMEGYDDPLCRGCYPWDAQNKLQIDFYRRLGELRQMPVFAEGDFAQLACDGGLYAFERKHSPSQVSVTVAVNCGTQPATLPLSGNYVDWFTGRRYSDSCILPCQSFVVLVKS